LNVSPTPVKEALLTLEGQGLVTFGPRRGVSVSVLTADDVQELIEARHMLEFSAVRFREAPLSDARASAMRTDLDAWREARKNGDLDGEFDAHGRFHRSIVEASENRALLAVYDTLFSRARIMYAYHRLSFGNSDEEIARHAEIVDALCEEKPDQGIRAVEAHFGVATPHITEEVGKVASEQRSDDTGIQVAL
jgi:DNA-binding GntR family transcriptional regulator